MIQRDREVDGGRVATLRRIDTTSDTKGSIAARIGDIETGDLTVRVHVWRATP